jgi:hypothetical protein
MIKYSFLKSDAQRPRVVKRGWNEVFDKTDPDEIDEIDHLCFVVHGIGEGCDMKFRPLVECVDDFRDISADIINLHLKDRIESEEIKGRIEFLPITWHADLHADTGVDELIKPITLESIPKLRQFSNSTLLDVIFYTSPIYCQQIISKVGKEINRLSAIFKQRNPNFCGKISLVGHSLGSLIVFDLLMNQKSDLDSNVTTKETSSSYTGDIEAFLQNLKLEEFIDLFNREKIDMESLFLLNEIDLKNMGLPLGPMRILLNAMKTEKFKKVLFIHTL